MNSVDPSGEIATANEIQISTALIRLLALTLATWAVIALRETFWVPLYHYTTLSKLALIRASGFIAGPRGNWFTPDIYASKKMARKMLAMENAPDLYLIMKIYPLKDMLVPPYPFAGTVHGAWSITDGTYLSGGGREYMTSKPIPFVSRLLAIVPLILP